jgi:hypothetical protein
VPPIPPILHPTLPTATSPSIFWASSPLISHENGPASDQFDALNTSGRSTRLRASLTTQSLTGRRDLASTVSVAPHVLALALAAAHAQERGPVVVRVVHERPREDREVADMLEQRLRSRRGGLVKLLLVWWVP